jgi:DNA-binding ferritin-like protein
MDYRIIESFINACSVKTASDNNAVNRWQKSKSKTSQIAVAETLLDGFIGKKTAQQAMDEEAHKVLSFYVAFTRAMYLLHQENHWAAKHYGDHLLFQRLYEEVQDEIIDDAAERVVGLCGSLLLQGTESEIVKKFAPKNDGRDFTLTSLLKSSLAIEKAFQSICKKTYDEIKNKDMMTLGLDDMIMAQASVGETHIYLLQQELKGYSE